MQSIADILLLGEGAGIRMMTNGKLVIQPEFNPFHPTHRAEALRLVNELADKVTATPGLECDYLAVFEERPATILFTQWLAVELSKRWQRSVDVLSVSRRGRHMVTFRYFRIGGLPGKRTEVYDLGHVRRDTPEALLGSKKVLIFAESVKGAAQEGFLRILCSRKAKALNVKVVGLASFAIINRGARRMIKRQLSLRKRQKLPIVFIAHLGYPASGLGQRTIGSRLAEAFARMLHRRT